MPTKQPEPQPVVWRVKRGYTVREGADYLGISEWVLRGEIREKRIAAKKRGSTLLIDQAELDRYFDDLPERGDADAEAS